MRKFLQVSFYEMAFYVEILISFILMIVLILATGSLAMNIMGVFHSQGPIEDYLQHFLNQAMSIAIGVELIKMLSKHTSATVIEVLLFAIARHVVVDQSSGLNSLWSILAIVSLFATRKYLFTNFDDSANIIVRGSQKVKIANILARVNLAGEKGELLRDFVARHLEAEEKHVTIGAAVYLNDVALRVDSIKDGVITRVEIIKSLS